MNEGLPRYFVPSSVTGADYPDEPVRESVLQEAERIINGKRQGDYGHPEQNFGRIAALWNIHLRNRLDPQGPITAQDTAIMMILLKVARLQATPEHRDSVVDLAGYAGTIEKLWERA